MADDHRGLDDERADPAVLVVVHVGAADADGADLDEDLAGPGLGDRSVLHHEVALAAEDGARVGPGGIVRMTVPGRGGGGGGSGHGWLLVGPGSRRWDHRARR